MTNPPKPDPTLATKLAQVLDWVRVKTRHAPRSGQKSAEGWREYALFIMLCHFSGKARPKFIQRGYKFKVPNWLLELELDEGWFSGR